jgi:hypothetical protein
MKPKIIVAKYINPDGKIESAYWHNDGVEGNFMKRKVSVYYDNSTIEKEYRLALDHTKAWYSYIKKGENSNRNPRVFIYKLNLHPKYKNQKLGNVDLRDTKIF